MPHLELTDFDYRALRRADGLEALDQRFQRELTSADPALARRLQDYRANRWCDDARHREFLIQLAMAVQGFLMRLFKVSEPVAAHQAAARRHHVLMRFRQEFVAKRGRHYRQPIDADFEQLDTALWAAVDAHGGHSTDRPDALAMFALAALDSGQNATVERISQWCRLALTTPAGQAAVGDWPMFKLPGRIDYARLIELRVVGNHDERLESRANTWRSRDGFALTDPRMAADQIAAEVDYCLYCHEQDGDFCSRGFPEKKAKPELGLKTNPLGEILTGCPLGEKISEMHRLKRDGEALAALAMIMLDNPMVPATGHRICNDCMKACVYQKQDPVDIPQIETRVLTDVLTIPWGVEIYDLLTRWNPLRPTQFVMQPYNGRKVLIAGMGPAGFTMAHHLTMAGCAVVGIDGLKIEPLSQALIDGPVHDYHDLEESLDERILAGFGGVSEYGITVRWDKNFLKLIYLSLLRRPTFQVFGGIRLGGTVRLQDAWNLGFDHTCLAIGAGEPKMIPVDNSLARGMRQANDFLMALQLTGAAKRSSTANLQVRMPAVIIGGGLTAVDAATEVQAYYIRQVETVLQRYERLRTEQGKPIVSGHLDSESRTVLAEFLAHGRAVRAERARAAAAGEAPNWVALLRRWGGVTIAYRRSLNESPAYLRNHEEILKAMEEGIYYAEALDPRRALLDDHGHVRAMEFRRRNRSVDGRWLETFTKTELPARTVLIAAGTSPNTIYEHEHPGTFRLDGEHFRPHVFHGDQLQPVQVAEHAKSAEFGPLTSYSDRQHTVSFLGDTHPVFHGSVVKAIASSARAYPHVLGSMDSAGSADPDAIAYQAFRTQMEHTLTARVVSVDTSHPAVIELWVRAPMAAANHRPGQFFRLQTYETGAAVVDGTRIQVPVATVSGAGVSGDKLRLMLLRWGGNCDIAARLKPGARLVLMGPTGAPTPIAHNKTVLVITGAWGAAVMLDIGPALRARGNRVILLAAYPTAPALFAKAELESTANQILWCTAGGDPINAQRDCDTAVSDGDALRVLRDYAAGTIRTNDPDLTIPLHEVDQIMVMGSTELLRGMQTAMRGDLGNQFKPGVDVIGMVGSPMQCMMKGVCAQCLQWQIDPDTGKRTRAVFSCAQQEQPLSWIDVDNLAARQGQNRLLEHLNGLWLNRVLNKAPTADSV